MDELIERVEQGEHIGVENEDGTKAVFVPLDDATYKMYTELNNEAQ
jgi:antitoxin (DNA-binding transcriptional repressor) of toxin-antitoxin stability system